MKTPHLFCLIAVTVLVAADAPPEAGKYFKITVLDDQTGRGVPLVELRTVNNLRYYTDSNGVVAFREPGLMGQTVFFSVKSHGYEFPKDGFGFRGTALAVKEGGHGELKIHRVNLAERLYRITGGGIYADSLLVGQPAPLRRPVLNGLVLGSDSVLTAAYRGKLYWFWGDTNRPGYPLGNYQTTGATSRLPGDGLDAETGIDLDYFTDDKGFARPMAPMPGEGPTWITGLVAVHDAAGRERLIASYAKVRNQLTIYERGLAEFNDEKQQFEKAAALDRDASVLPVGHTFLHTVNGIEYAYFAAPYPLVRVPADMEHVLRPADYEAFTCLEEGTRPEQNRLDRARDGSLRYGWKKNTTPVGPREQAMLIKAGVLKSDEALLQLQDVATGKRVTAHSGSVSWNKYRGRWVLITVEAGGTSALGEVWYAEADTPVGPWVYARKIVTHDRYSFYNPKQHPLFDTDGGRIIYFEGTYTHTFSGNPEATPRYDYNQILYKLDLADPRLSLPVPVYPMEEEKGDRFVLRSGRKAKTAARVAFFALDRPVPGSVAGFEEQGDGGWALKVGGPRLPAEARPLFHALPADTKEPPATTLPLYEYVQQDGKRRFYSTDGALSRPGYQKSSTPVCLVWRKPASMPSLGD